MKKLLIPIFCLFISTTAFSQESYQEFLKLREKIYQNKHSGLSEVPILNKLDQNSRLSGMKTAKENLLNFLGDRTQFSDYENLLIDSIMTLDEMSNYSSKQEGAEVDEDFYITPFGLKVSTKCFEKFERAQRSHIVPTEEIEKSDFEDFVYGMYSEGAKELGAINFERKLLEQIGVSIKKMNTCAKNYPSVKPFIKKWMNSLKVTTLHCRDSLAATSGVLGTAVPDYMPLIMGKNLYLPPESFLSFLNQQSVLNHLHSESRNTFIHEVLHLSFADNKEAGLHNDPSIHEISPTCDDSDRLSDRVYFISNLCTGKHHFEEEETEYLPEDKVLDFDEIMAKKINKCGMKNACSKHFDDPKFCKEIKQMGECKTSYKHSTITPPHIKKNIESAFLKLKSYVSKCLDSSRLERKAGCPSKRYLNLPSNQMLKGIFHEFNYSDDENIKAQMYDFTLISYLSSHPKTKDFLSQSKWGQTIEFLKGLSKSEITKKCREKIEMKLVFDNLENNNQAACK